MGVEDYKSIFLYMLQSGLCSKEDWPRAKELVQDWINIYNETSNQNGVSYEPNRLRDFYLPQGAY